MARLEEKLVNLSSIAPKARTIALPLTLEQYRVQVAATAVVSPKKAFGSTPIGYYSHLLNDSSLRNEDMLRTMEYYYSTTKKHGGKLVNH